MNHPSKFDPRGIVPEGAKWKKRRPLSDLLSKYTPTPSGCWDWTGSRNLQGYGVVGLFIDGRPIGIPAPRLQWMHSHGPIPDGLVIMHSCDNPGCINPDHLALGTQASNLTDMRAKGRHNTSGLKNADSQRKLTA
jgi:hypothetical protein